MPMKRLKEVILIILTTALLLNPVSSEAVLKQIDFLIDGVHGKSNQQLTGGWVYTYAAGTTSPKAIYSTSTGSTVHANPAQLDSYGRLQAWGDGLYKFVLKDSAFNTIYTIDGLEYTSMNNSIDRPNPLGDPLYQSNVISSSVVSLALTASNTITTNASVTTLMATTSTLVNATVSSLTAGLGSALDANNFKLTEVATGTTAQDAVNYGQVVSYDAIVTTSAAANASAACAVTVPKGVIAMWYGTEDNVPSGWHLCNGASDTPDLRGWFIRSASGTDVDIGSWTSPYATSFSRASETYECPMTSYASGTATSTGGLYPLGSSTADVSTYTVGLTHIGGYYALAYIMKL